MYAFLVRTKYDKLKDDYTQQPSQEFKNTFLLKIPKLAISEAKEAITRL